MKKICIVLAAATAVLASGASATTVGSGYTSKGECSRAIAWANYDARKGISNPLGVLPPNAKCEKVGGLWYVSF